MPTFDLDTCLEEEKRGIRHDAPVFADVARIANAVGMAARQNVLRTSSLAGPRLAAELLARQQLSIKGVASLLSGLFKLPPFKAPRFELPPELTELLEALQAFHEDDEGPLLEWAERRIGHRPDPLLCVRLRAGVSEAGDGLLIRAMTAFVDAHGERIAKKSESANLPTLTHEIRQGISKRYGSFDQALDSLALQGQKHDEVLEEMIPGVAYAIHEDLQPGQNLSGKVASQIRREGPERPDKPGAVFAPGPDNLFRYVGELDLAAFYERELLARRVHDAGLSPQELESFVFGELFGGQEAAAMLDRTANQIRQEKSRALRKLRRASGT